MRVLRYWRLGLGATLLSGALGVGAALAADPAVPTYPECTKKAASTQDSEAAKSAHKVATEFYDRGEYDKAIRSWNDAFGFDCSANALLINIANAYEKKGDRADAVTTLEEYLKRTGPNANIQTKVQNLKAAMAPPPESASVAPSASAPPTATAPPPSASATVPPPPIVEAPRPYGNAPWALVGGGGALAIVGAILLPVGVSAINSANAACPSHINCGTDIASQGNTGDKERNAGGALLGAGVAVAVGGLIWQFAANKPPAPQPTTGRVHPLHPHPRDLWVTPVAGAGHGGVAAGGSF